MPCQVKLYLTSLWPSGATGQLSLVVSVNDVSIISLNMMMRTNTYLKIREHVAKSGIDMRVSGSSLQSLWNMPSDDDSNVTHSQKGLSLMMYH